MRRSEWRSEPAPQRRQYERLPEEQRERKDDDRQVPPPVARDSLPLGFRRIHLLAYFSQPLGFILWLESLRFLQLSQHLHDLAVGLHCFPLVGVSGVAIGPHYDTLHPAPNRRSKQAI